MKATKKKVPVSSGGYVNYRDVNLRKFNGKAKIAHCEAVLARFIGVPAEAVQIYLPSGRRAPRASNLTRLRKNWLS
ncbi:MAG: hypothetical protein ACK5DD_04200 [Cyclobacteriaceae bacterium]|jgi:hypothetical protein